MRTIYSIFVITEKNTQNKKIHAEIIAVDARENQIFLHIFTSPCLMQNQNVLILITIPTFLLVTDHHAAINRDDTFFHQIYDIMAVRDNDDRRPLPVDLF